MERSPTRDLVVGVFVVAGLAAIAYLSISIGGFAWHGPGQLKVYAVFNETGDLTVRAPVVIAGVRVGEVSKISLTDAFRARVEMILDPKLKLAKDTSASIVTAGMLGDRYIALDPGDEDAVLKSGDQLPRTNSAMILEQLLQKLAYGVTKSQQEDKKPATEPGK